MPCLFVKGKFGVTYCGEGVALAGGAVTLPVKMYDLQRAID